MARLWQLIVQGVAAPIVDAGLCGFYLLPFAKSFKSPVLLVFGVVRGVKGKSRSRPPRKKRYCANVFFFHSLHGTE